MKKTVTIISLITASLGQGAIGSAAVCLDPASQGLADSTAHEATVGELERLSPTRFHDRVIPVSQADFPGTMYLRRIWVIDSQENDPYGVSVAQWWREKPGMFHVYFYVEREGFKEPIQGAGPDIDSSAKFSIGFYIHERKIIGRRITLDGAGSSGGGFSHTIPASIDGLLGFHAAYGLFPRQRFWCAMRKLGISDLTEFAPGRVPAEMMCT